MLQPATTKQYEEAGPTLFTGNVAQLAVSFDELAKMQGALACMR